MEMLNVLINAYAVSPTWGSEPGVGWNWIVNLAKYCNVFVITESEWQSEIEAALEKLPQKDNIHFYFNPIPEHVRKICWNQGDWRFYIHYKKWQKQTFKMAQQIISEHKIDIIHQLNMIGFREPGYLWKVKDIPFVWGPIGNMSPVPTEFLGASAFPVKLKNNVKNTISYIQARSGRVRQAIRRADQLIVALNGTADIIRDVYGINNIITMPETGLTPKPFVEHQYSSDGKLKILWVGRFIPTKKLDLALLILSKLKNRDVELHIVGWGTESEEKYYKQMAEDLKVSDLCKWYGKIPNAQVQSMMKSCHLFLFTSVLEGTPHVILEAISNNLPIVCFDLCGQSVIVNEKVGRKIHVDSLGEATMKMTECVDDLNRNRQLLKEMSLNCENRKPELTWENKIDQVVTIYQSLIKN